ncbi:MAG: ABC transporter substrate-binding protein [Cyanobacteria bacterium P01_C01_bin.118]
MTPEGENNLRKSDTSQDLFSLKVFLAAVGILGLVFLALTWLSRGELGLDAPTGQQSEEVQLEPLSEPELPSRLSQGEQVLLLTSTLPLKADGADALIAGDYDAAVRALEQAREVDMSDPETLIYLNNARIGDNPAHSFAVIAPLSNTPEAAAHLLRGVAQAQTEINQAEGVEGTPVRIIVADDQGEVAIAEAIATELSQSTDVLGVIGHSSAATADAAAAIYASETLPFVSATGSASQSLLSSDLPIAKALAFYMDKLNHRTAILFYDGNSDYSLNFRGNFQQALKTYNGTMTAEINLADLPDSAPTGTPEAEIFALSPGNSPLETAKNSIEIIPNDKVDHFYRHVFGGHELFSPEVLELFGSMATGTILAVPDSIYQSPASPFSESPSSLWQTPVDWTTSATYNTIQTMVAGVQTAPDRDGVQQALDNVSDETVKLLRVRINPDAATGYELLSIGTMTQEGFTPE